jgi:hypothetical protein
MLHITEEMGMSTEHIGGLQGIQNLAQRRHRMVGFATEAKPRRTAVREQNIDSLPVHRQHRVDICLCKKATGSRIATVGGRCL